MWFLQKGNNYPYLEIVEDLVSKGLQLMVHTKVLPKLEEMFKGGIMWREKASRVFLRKNTPYTLMEVHFSSPKSITSSAVPWVFNVMVHYWLPLVVQYNNGCTIQEQWWCNNMNKDIWLGWRGVSIPHFSLTEKYLFKIWETRMIRNIWAQFQILEVWTSFQSFWTGFDSFSQHFIIK